MRRLRRGAAPGAAGRAGQHGDARGKPRLPQGGLDVNPSDALQVRADEAVPGEDEIRDLGDPYCPGCRSDVDPFEHRGDGKVWISRVCEKHGVRAGSADGLVPGELGYLSGGGESGDLDSRRMIALLRGSGAPAGA